MNYNQYKIGNLKGRKRYPRTSTRWNSSPRGFYHTYSSLAMNVLTRCCLFPYSIYLIRVGDHRLGKVEENNAKKWELRKKEKICMGKFLKNAWPPKILYCMCCDLTNWSQNVQWPNDMSSDLSVNLFMTSPSSRFEVWSIKNVVICGVLSSLYENRWRVRPFSSHMPT